MRMFLDRLLNTKGDPTLQVVDLLLFLGYFSLCLYGGGVAYDSSYTDAFHLQARSDVPDPSVGIAFVTKVLLTHWYWLPSAVYLLVFILLYYASRYIWRPWFGYFLMSLLLYFTFVACSLIGRRVAIADAESDKQRDTSSKPEIKLYAALPDADYASGNYRLLSEDSTWFFVFEPQGVPGSVIQVHAVPKAKVERYEVFVK